MTIFKENWENFRET